MEWAWCQPAENSIGSGWRMCCRPQKRQTVGSRRSPSWRGEAYLLAPFYSAAGLRRGCGQKRNYAEAQVRLWTNMHDGTIGAEKQRRRTVHATVSFPPCSFPRCHCIFHCLTLGPGTTSDAVEPDRAPGVPSPLCDEDLGTGPGGLESFRFVGRSCPLAGKCDLYRVLCTPYVAQSGYRAFFRAEIWWVPGFPIEQGKKLSAGLDDESGFCGD